MDQTRNSNPVNALLNLPVETLAHIFYFLLDPDSTEDTLEDDCIRASQVCFRWRQIALKTPKLWTRIPASNPRWVFALLKRSANMKIQVEFYPITPWHTRTKILLWLFRYRHNRIDTISLVEVDWSYISPILSAAPSSGFPQLRRLCLEPHTGRVSASDQPSIEEMLQKTQHLSSLKLPFYLDFGRTGRIDVHHLTELAVIDPHNPDTPSLLQWLNALKNMSSLRILTIEGQVPKSSTELSGDIPVVASEVVALTHLQRIRLSDKARNIYEFVKHLSFSPEASLRLELEFLEADVTDLDKMRSFMEGYLHSYRDVGVWQCIQLAPYETDGETPHPSFSAWHGLSLSDWPTREEPPQVDPKVCVVLMSPRSEIRDPAVLHLILVQMASLMKCKDVEYLDILQSDFADEDEDDGTTEFVCAIVDEFGSMHGLRAISFENTNSTPALLKALSTTLPPKPELEINRPLPFETLRILQFVSYRLHRRYLLQLPQVFEVLRNRQEAGRPVTSVAFYSCEFPQRFFKQRRAMLEGDYRPWKQEESVEAEELQVHVDDIKSTFYFYNCGSYAEATFESDSDEDQDGDGEIDD